MIFLHINFLDQGILIRTESRRFDLQAIFSNLVMHTNKLYKQTIFSILVMHTNKLYKQTIFFNSRYAYEQIIYTKT